MKSSHTYMIYSYINLGIANRPFVCADARPDDLLPMDEASWEAGVCETRHLRRAATL